MKAFACVLLIGSSCLTLFNVSGNRFVTYMDIFIFNLR